MTQRPRSEPHTASTRLTTLAKHSYSFYLGKKVAFVYRAQKEVRGSKIRVMWGKVTRPHGMMDYKGYTMANV